MSEEKVKNREELFAPVIAKTWEDENFKKKLLDNPKVVLQKKLGVKFRSDVNINVVEESSRQLYLVLPPAPSDELSDEQLEAVAGGFSLGGFDPTSYIQKAYNNAVHNAFESIRENLHKQVDGAVDQVESKLSV